MKRTTMLRLGIALVGVGAMAAAWVSQHWYDMQPCPWCVLQRAIFGALALVAALSLPLAKWPWARLALDVSGLALALSGGAAACWQHFKAAAQASCNLTLADKIVSAFQLDTLWPGMFSATASCADAAIDLFGLPYEYWSLALFTLLAATWVGLIWMRRAPSTS